MPAGIPRPLALLALVLALPALSGCADLLPRGEAPCARFEAEGWTPERSAGEPVEVRARLRNCGERGLSAPTCPDGTLLLAFRVENMTDARDVTVSSCPGVDQRGPTSRPGSAVVPPGGALAGAARWDGMLQRCDTPICEPPRAPPPGDYTLALHAPGVEATARLPLRLRA